MGSSRTCEVEEADGEIHAYFVHADHIGSSNILTNESGQRASLFEYKPFGTLAYAHEDNTYDTDKRFNGRTYDSSVGLIFYGGRYYLPDVGRWLTPDPTVQHPYDPQNLNRYSFCQNNPLNAQEINGYGFFSWLKKNWQGVLAITMIVVSVAVLCIAPYTAPYMVPTLIAQISGAIIGGSSAAARGGNIGSGMLFGVLAGTVTGGSLGAMSKLGYGGFTLGEMAMAAEGGGAAGLTRGYAGGKGSVQDMIKQAALGAGTAAIVAGAFGVLQGHPLLPEVTKGGVPTTPAGAEGTKGEDASASSPGTTADPENITPTSLEEKAREQLIVDPPTPKPNPRDKYESEEFTRWEFSRKMLEKASKSEHKPLGHDDQTPATSVPLYHYFSIFTN